MLESWPILDVCNLNCMKGCSGLIALWWWVISKY